MKLARLDLLRLGAAARGVVELGTGGAPSEAPFSPEPVQQAPIVPHPTMMGGELASFPPPEKWDDWVEYESKDWPRKVERRYMLVPTTCFNCEAGCGLLAYVDKESMQVRKFEGNPVHPGSRGRNCAKGPATLNQTYDPERLLYPLKRVGPRGGGQWERTTWDEVLETFAEAIRAALIEGRRNEVVYHVGRPGEDGYMEKILQSWGIDGHNSHTNVCSSSARLGYDIWQGFDRPSPDHANARFMLLMSSHLETGHYFNPHAQRIIEGKMKGAKLAVIDPRLSNTASMADYWLAPWPGTEAALLLAIANYLLQNDLFDREFVRKWTNWDEYMREERPAEEPTFDNFLSAMRQEYATYTFESAASESGVAAEQIRQIADEVAGAGSAFSAHIWRGAASGNIGGWLVARALELLNVLTGSIGAEGGTSPNGWDKFVPVPFKKPPPQKVWNELLWPLEYPLSHHEMSYLLPHFLKENRGKLSAYFTRVYNPVWTNPDGATWIEVLRDESKIELHGCLTPTWSETAWFADYVLPMGHGGERHDTMSYETHSAKWLGFRQPVTRVAMEKMGKPVEFTYESNPGEVWEEDEFFIELCWRIDPDGSLGIRQYYESPYRPGEKITILEHYRWLFENSVPGLPEAAAVEGLTPLAYMQKYGVFLVQDSVYNVHEKPLSERELEGTYVDQTSGVVLKGSPPSSTGATERYLGVSSEPAAPTPVGVKIDGVARNGFPTPSRKLEIYSRTLKEWKWPEFVLPAYEKSHVHWEKLDRANNEFPLIATFRLPTLIHTRSGNAKWLNEISHTNPLWIHPSDAARLGLETGALVKISTDIGYFVSKCWVTEAIRPGVVACSHHLGRWRLNESSGGERWSSAFVDLAEQSAGKWRMRQVQGVQPWKSDDPDSSRVWWSDAGVHQNMTFPVHPDPVSGMHCWHNKVRLERVGPDDRYGDIFVDTEKSFAVYREWLGMTRPAPGPGGLRRPMWLARPYKPAPEAYRVAT